MDSERAGDLYLDLIVRSVLGLIYEDRPNDPWSGGAFDPAVRAQGRDWPSQAHSMIGALRMNNLVALCRDVIARGVPGDFIETGVWRGGACIAMRAVLKAYGETRRTVWACDSFEGLPKADPAHFPQDAGDEHAKFGELAVSLEKVQSNFARYGLLDQQVRFVKGWFRDTLPTLLVSQLAILRLDGDMYESTIEALDTLYPKLSAGGYAIIDDYGAVPACAQAVADYRARHGISDDIITIDWTGVYWRKSA